MTEYGIYTKYATLIVLVIVGFTIITALYGEASTATDNVNASNMCTAAGCFYNSTRTTYDCTANNETPADTTRCAGTAYGEGFPLSTLFASGGILFIVISATLLMLYIKRSK